jgi:hypothetical protein
MQSQHGKELPVRRWHRHRQYCQEVDWQPRNERQERWAHHPSVIEAQSHHWATWDTVPTPTDVRPITSKLVFKRKYGPDGQVFRHKARLVAGGFQQAEGIDYEGTFAAVVKPASYRILFAIAAIYSWLIHQADVKTAFLNGALPKRVRNL